MRSKRSAWKSVRSMPELVRWLASLNSCGDLLNRNGDLPWASIHRAMMAVASLSGGEPEHRNGRKHITDGLFEHHKHRAPDNTQAREYKVLVET